ncbi:MAG: tetratricopeptide repeat protein [Nostoc sp.]
MNLAINLNSSNANAYFNLAIALEKQGQKVFLGKRNWSLLSLQTESLHFK